MKDSLQLRVMLIYDKLANPRDKLVSRPRAKEPLACTLEPLEYQLGCARPTYGQARCIWLPCEREQGPVLDTSRHLTAHTRDSSG